MFELSIKYTIFYYISPSPVHPTGFYFCFFPGFFAILVVSQLMIGIVSQLMIGFRIMGVQKGRYGLPKIQFSSKVAKFAGKIGIYLTLIFRIDYFSCAILIFWDMIDIVFFSYRKKMGFLKKLHFLLLFLCASFLSRWPLLRGEGSAYPYLG